MSQLYLGLAELPVPTSATFFSSNVIRLTFSIRDHVRNLKRSTSKTLLVASDTVHTSPSQEIGDVVASVLSPSKKRVANLRETIETSGKKKRFVEVWSGDILQVCHEVTELHDSFYKDDHLGSLSFNVSETRLLYSAEANPPKDGNDDDTYAKFRFTPHFGEGLRGKKRPAVYLFKWRNPEDEDKEVSNQKPSEVSVEPWVSLVPGALVGQAIFVGENHAFATGYLYTEEGRLLGPKGCFNRPATICQFVIGDAKPYSLENELQVGRSYRSVRHFSDDNESVLFWLSNERGGAHASCVTLHSFDLKTSQGTTVLDTVWEPRPDGFPGFYPDFNLPTQPFLKFDSSTNLHIVAHSVWGSRSTVLLISTKDGSVKNLTPDGAYSWSVLGTDGRKQVVCTRSSPSVPHEVVLGQLSGSGDVSWRVIDKPVLSEEIANKLSTLKTSIIPIPNRHPVETIVIQPGSDSTLPCITVPHGGPHGTSMTSFSAPTAALALQGYTLSFPNYTGSLGYGETFVQKLLGQCGTLDVQDCMASVQYLIDLGISERGSKKQLIQGGSHGGFLAAHLIGQYPGFFGAAVMRNPVVSCETSTTDIPDWYYAEFGVPFTHTSVMTPELYAKLQPACPISYVDAVMTPVLLLIGEVDQRVAPTQGAGYYHALKGRGKKVEMLVFPGEGHPLDGVEAGRVGWEAGLDWLVAGAR